MLYNYPMKKILLTLIFTTSLFAGELNWIHDYNKGLTLAKKEHKDVYLFIGADACKYCKKFKETTLSKKYVMQKLNAAFIPVYLSRDQHKIPDKFEKYGAPRHYFLSADGKIFDEDAGYLSPERFLSLIKEVEFYK
jgi:thiol:disulfide interchange protein